VPNAECGMRNAELKTAYLFSVRQFFEKYCLLRKSITAYLTGAASPQRGRQFGSQARQRLVKVAQKATSPRSGRQTSQARQKPVAPFRGLRTTAPGPRSLRSWLPNCRPLRGLGRSRFSLVGASRKFMRDCSEKRPRRFRWTPLQLPPYRGGRAVANRQALYSLSTSWRGLGGVPILHSSFFIPPALHATL